MKRSLLIGAGLALALSSCGEKDDKKKGRPLNLPAIQPPVVEATPAGLETNAASLITLSCGSDAGTPIERIKSRLFCPGPGDFRYRLGMIDGRIAEYDKRAQDNLAVCVDDETKTWNPTGLPEDFPMKISCYETMDGGDSGLSVYFGQDETHSYIAEAQDPGENSEAPSMGVYAKIANSGDQVAFWQGVNDDNNTSSWMYLVADRATKTMEFVAVGTSLGFGVGCGVNLKSNADLVYVKGVVNDEGFPGGCDNTDNGWGSNDLAVDLCFNAETMAETTKSECETAGLTELTMEEYTSADAAEWDTQGLAEKLAKSGGIPAGIRSFTESKLPTGDSE